MKQQRRDGRLPVYDPQCGSRCRIRSGDLLHLLSIGCATTSGSDERHGPAEGIRLRHQMTSGSWAERRLLKPRRCVCRCCSRKSGTFSFMYCDKSAAVFSKGNSALRLLTGWRMRGCRIQTNKTFCSPDTLLFLSCQTGSSAAPPRARRRPCVCV